MSWTPMRSRFTAFRMLPSRSVSTPRRLPISRASTLVPRNAEPGDLGQRIENFLCDTITEIFLIAFGAEISERQDGDQTNPRFSVFCRLSDLSSRACGLTPYRLSL